MMYESFARYATEKPDAIAIYQVDGIQMSYLQAFQFLNALMVILRSECPDIDKHQPVGVACKSARLQMFLLVALEALGIPTITYVQPIDAGVADTVGICGLFIGEHRPHNAREFLQINQAFFDKVARVSGNVKAVPAPWAPDRVARFLTTSGSTGRAKIMPLTCRIQRLRVERRVLLCGFSASSRTLMFSMDSASLYHLQAAISQGGAVIFFNYARLAEHLALATDVLLLPIHLSDLLKALPAGYVPQSPLDLYCGGAPLGAPLRERAIARLGARIIARYGTNECGVCALFDAEGLGTVLPGVELEVIDRDFNVVPHGTEGQIRIRGEELVAGYTDPQLTREYFVDGWFLTGDLGVMPQARYIRLTGRSQTMLNFGGVKHSPDLLEQVLEGVVMAEDFAVCGKSNADGIDELQLAVVRSRLDDVALAAAVTHVIRSSFAAIYLYRLDAIPRSSNGKVRRQMLAEQLGQSPGVRIAG